MKVKIDIVGFQKLSRITGAEQFEFSLNGKNVNDLLHELIGTFGKELKEAFEDGQGIFNPMIQLILNGKEWIPAYRYKDTILKEGDVLSFIVLLAGG